MKEERRERLVRWCFEKMYAECARPEEMAEILHVPLEEIEAMIQEEREIVSFGRKL